MKKLLLMACAALMLAGTSCNGFSGGKTLKDCKTADDSISYYVGILTAQAKEQILQSPDSAKFDAAQFIKGYEAIMCIDTANISYLMGVQAAFQAKGAQLQFGEDGINLDAATIVKAFSQVAKGDTSAIDPQFAQQEMQRVISEARNRKNFEKAEANKQAAADFLAKKMNEDKAIKKLPSGLAIKVIEEGKGNTFANDTLIYVIYTGKKIDGAEFDSSNGSTVKFDPRAVVPGFAEALRMMKPGAHYEVYIPGDLGYGNQGQPYAGIEPGAMLIFDIQTPGKEVKAAPAPAPAPVGK